MLHELGKHYLTRVAMERRWDDNTGDQNKMHGEIRMEGEVDKVNTRGQYEGTRKYIR
jgi:hypothetical protein